MPILPGTILDGRYRIVSELGKGGMGAVFLAENTRVRKQVAIKVLHKELASSAEVLQRFENEAQAAAQIGSDHIVQVFDFGTTEEGDRYMVMELLEGETLKARLRKTHAMAPTIAAPLFVQLLDGLSAAHAAGIVHRDMKPENVFLQRENAGQRDWVKLLDFGISKFSALTGEDGSMTKTGVVMGTPFFMSPEQAKSAHLADARSDLYSVAAMLFQALTGDVPFRASTLTEMLFKVVFEPLPHPRERNPNLGDAISNVILRGMAREPTQRFQSAVEFKHAIVAACNEGPAAYPQGARGTLQGVGAPVIPADAQPLLSDGGPSAAYSLGDMRSYPGIGSQSHPGVMVPSYPGTQSWPNATGALPPPNPPPSSAPAPQSGDLGASSPSLGPNGKTQGAWDAQVDGARKPAVPAWLLGVAGLSVVGLVVTGALLLGGGGDTKKKASSAPPAETAAANAKTPDPPKDPPKADPPADTAKADAPKDPPKPEAAKAEPGKAEPAKPEPPKAPVAEKPKNMAPAKPQPAPAGKPGKPTGPKVVEGMGY